MKEVSLLRLQELERAYADCGCGLGPHAACVDTRRALDELIEIRKTCKERICVCGHSADAHVDVDDPRRFHGCEHRDDITGHLDCNCPEYEQEVDMSDTRRTKYDPAFASCAGLPSCPACDKSAPNKCEWHLWVERTIERHSHTTDCLHSQIREMGILLDKVGKERDRALNALFAVTGSRDIVYHEAMMKSK